MNKLLLILLLASLLSAGKCDDTISLSSICTIDLPVDEITLDTVICFTSKKENLGFTLRQLQNRISVDEVDLRKITEKLKQCQTTE